MAGQRWSNSAAVRREDQFTAAPEFIDRHDSRHLPMWGRIGAAWHGMSTARRVVVVASIVAFSTAGGTSIAFTIDDFGREVGTQPHASGGLAAEDGGEALPSAPPLPTDDSLLNGTVGPPVVPGP